MCAVQSRPSALRPSSPLSQGKTDVRVPYRNPFTSDSDRNFLLLPLITLCSPVRTILVSGATSVPPASWARVGTGLKRDLPSSQSFRVVSSRVPHWSPLELGALRLRVPGRQGRGADGTEDAGVGRDAWGTTWVSGRRTTPGVSVDTPQSGRVTPRSRELGKRTTTPT